MKVADLIKITDDNTEVFIYTQQRNSYCDHEACDCMYYSCEDCEYGESMLVKLEDYEQYHGKAKGVPIALADQKVKEISANFRQVYVKYGRKHKTEPTCYLTIKI